ncbi:MAG TPA: NAD(P)-dependent oxidoreductase [bacterium]|nr:NAD(P)-dependent oxidoreductase [bacterium]
MPPVSLVTGACGFMGTHMVDVLAEAGHTIRATDLAQSYDHDDIKTGRFPSVLKKRGVEFIPADVTNRETLEKILHDVEYVFHIAAIFSYSAPWDILYRVNVEGTRHLLELLQKVPSFKKMVLWAAGGVYRFPRGPADLPITEKSSIEPQNNYLKSKWEQECLVRDFCKQHGMRFSAMRPTTVYGPRAVYGGGQMIHDALAMKKLMIPRNFTFRIPTVHVRDVCRAALFLAEHPQTDGESYNLNDNSKTTTVEYFRMMARLTGKPFKALPTMPLGLVRFNLQIVAALGKLRWKIFGGRPPKFERDSIKYFGVDYVCDNSKLKSTGFQFEYPEFEKGLEATLPWYRENFGL